MGEEEVCIADGAVREDVDLSDARAVELEAEGFLEIDVGLARAGGGESRSAMGLDGRACGSGGRGGGRPSTRWNSPTTSGPTSKWSTEMHGPTAAMKSVGAEPLASRRGRWR